MGRPDTGLLVVADFDTPAARALGLITAPPAPRQTVHRVVGHPEDLTSATAAAAAVVAERTGSSGY
jgi:hypothetical protein